MTIIDDPEIPGLAFDVQIQRNGPYVTVVVDPMFGASRLGDLGSGRDDMHTDASARYIMDREVPHMIREVREHLAELLPIVSAAHALTNGKEIP